MEKPRATFYVLQTGYSQFRFQNFAVGRITRFLNIASNLKMTQLNESQPPFICLVPLVLLNKYMFI